MGSKVPKYTPEVPQVEEVKLSRFPLQVAKIDIIPGKVGWSRYKVSLPQSFRMLYYSDILYGPDWRELILDFDKRLLVLLNTLWTLHSFLGRGKRVELFTPGTTQTTQGLTASIPITCLLLLLAHQRAQCQRQRAPCRPGRMSQPR